MAELPGETISGRTVRRLRGRKRWSQKQLAEAAGVNRTTIGLIETGRITRPYQPTIQAIADALGVPVEDILAPS